MVEVLVEVNLFDEFETVLFGSLDECVKRNQEFVDIEDLTRHKALAYGIGQVEVVLQTKRSVSPRE